MRDRVVGVRTYRATDDIRISQQSSIQLDWKVITLSNMRTTWTIGLDLLSFGADVWSNAKWRAAFSL